MSFLLLFAQRFQYAQDETQGCFIGYIQQTVYLFASIRMCAFILAENDAVKGYIQDFGNLEQYFNRWLTMAAFDMLHVGWRYLQLFRQLFLRNFFVFAPFTDIFPQQRQFLFTLHIPAPIFISLAYPYLIENKLRVF